MTDLLDLLKQRESRCATAPGDALTRSDDQVTSRLSVRSKHAGRSSSWMRNRARCSRACSPSSKSSPKAFSVSFPPFPTRNAVLNSSHKRRNRPHHRSALSLQHRSSLPSHADGQERRSHSQRLQPKSRPHRQILQEDQRRSTTVLAKVLSSSHPLSRRYAALSKLQPISNSANFTGIPDDLATKLTNGLAQDYLQALQELYVNFHGQLCQFFTLNPSHFVVCSSGTSRLLAQVARVVLHALRAAKTQSPRERRSVGRGNQLDVPFSQSRRFVSPPAYS